MKRLFSNKKIIIFLLLIFLGMLISSVGLASEINWPDTPAGHSLDPASSSLPELVRYIYEWGISLGGLAVFIVLIIAGFLWLTSAGKPAQLQEAKSRMISAVGGLALLLASWLILNTINPALTTLTPPSFEGKAIPTTTEKITREEREPCTEVKVYGSPNFGGTQLATATRNTCIDCKKGWLWWKSGVSKSGSSRGYIGDTPTPDCKGELQLFENTGCRDMIATFPPTTRTFGIDREALSLTLYVANVEGFCVGFIKNCSDFNKRDECKKRYYCEWKTKCKGNNCSGINTKVNCEKKEGCSWEEKCDGTATPCSSFDNKSDCKDQAGCTWSQ